MSPEKSPVSISDIQIRACAPADAAVLSDLAKRCFKDTFTGTCTEEDMEDFLETYYNEARLEQELKQSDECTFFAEIEGKPIAYLRICEGVPPFPAPADVRPLELSRLYVDLPFKGTGVAKQLMQYYMDYGQANGYNYLWLGVWEYNYRAQAFYKKYGFRFNGNKHPFPIGQTPQTDEWWDLRIDEQNAG
jgi:ribosomal protein S18 acetylase RimI-like enzyme